MREEMSGEKNMETRKETWETPTGLFAYLDAFFQFEADIAASAENRKCRKFISSESNGLEIEESIDSTSVSWVFANPPYKPTSSAMTAELRRIFNWKNVVALIPAAFANRWFEVAFRECQDFFIVGRVQFTGAEYPTKFDLCLAVKSSTVKLTDEVRSALNLISVVSFCYGQAPLVGGAESRARFLDICRS
jgi:phage N-6-adenine-methyltransferase